MSDTAPETPSERVTIEITVEGTTAAQLCHQGHLIEESVHRNLHQELDLKITSSRAFLSDVSLASQLTEAQAARERLRVAAESEQSRLKAEMRDIMAEEKEANDALRVQNTELLKAAREFYTAAAIVMEPDATEDEHFRAIQARDDLRAVLTKHPEGGRA